LVITPSLQPAGRLPHPDSKAICPTKYLAYSVGKFLLERAFSYNGIKYFTKSVLVAKFGAPVDTGSSATTSSVGTGVSVETGSPIVIIVGLFLLEFHKLLKSGSDSFVLSGTTTLT
jgi:hypothetical protein